jgi:DNA-directed RNA polymerase specialized sigma24 family protein
MARPLTDTDYAILKYRSVVRAAAAKVAKKVPRVPFDDLLAACWQGAWEGLRDYDPARGELERCVWWHAYYAGKVYARGERARGMTYAPRGGEPVVTDLPDSAPRTLRDRDPVTHPLVDWDAVLSALPRWCRGVLALRFRDGLGHPEIAKRLGLSGPASSHSMMSQGLAKLRKLYPTGELPEPQAA